jgi:hypothetical protein
VVHPTEGQLRRNEQGDYYVGGQMNSDYESVAAARDAIDRYFQERNTYFKKNPKRAGNKLWGEELVPSKFSESNNCKNPKWMNLAAVR